MRALFLAVAFAVAIASVCVTQPENANYTLPARSRPSAGCINDTWTSTSITNVPEARGEHTAVWTGSEMIIWGGDGSTYLNTGARYNPTTDSWTATSTTNAPGVRYSHTAVWTGSEMIVWGGSNGNPLNTGGRYNPVTDSWTSMSTTNAPQARYGHTAVWTGSEMIVWGGQGFNGLNTGGRYNPVTDTWIATTTINAPTARQWSTAVWTGSEMIVWGGADNFGHNQNTGGRYNPVTDSWTATSISNAPSARTFHTAVWTGSEMIVWGGADSNGSLDTGGKYNPIMDTWTATSSTNVPEDRSAHTAVWTGSEMIVWGGVGSSTDLNTGGRYNASMDSWTATSTTNNVPSARASHTAIWTGSEMIVWGGSYFTALDTGGRYCAQSGVTPTPTATATVTPTATPSCTPGGTPEPWTQAAPVGIDHYGGFMDSNGTYAYEGGGYSFTMADNINQFGRFDPVANTWTSLAPVPDLNNSMASGVYAPNVNKLFVFGGDRADTGTYVDTTRIYGIATNTWSTGANMPNVRSFMASGYYNGKIYLVAGYDASDVTRAQAQVWEYDPITNTFNATRTNHPHALGGPGFGIINGHLYTVGGRDASNTVVNLVYDYDIAADTWTERANVPTAINVPGSAVIAGKLWVFGGGNPFVGSGTSPESSQNRMLAPDTINILQIYDPATDTWTSGPTLNQLRSFPAGRNVGNTAVAVGGRNGSVTTTSVEINVTIGGCSPTATPTQPPPSPTATATATPTLTPRPSRTPRPRPTPAPRP